MRHRLPFAYRLVLRESPRHKPIEAMVRERADFDVDDFDELGIPMSHIEGDGDHDRRIVARGTVYRPLPRPVSTPAAFAGLFDGESAKIETLRGRPAHRFWWTTPYGDLPDGYPLGFPTVAVLQAKHGITEGRTDRGNLHEAWVSALSQTRERVALIEGRIWLASAEPTWTIRAGGGRGVSIALMARPGPAHLSFSLGRREAAVAFAASMPGFDGVVPGDITGVDLDGRSDAVAMAQTVHPMMPGLWQAAGVLGDAEANGNSCYASIARIILESPPLAGEWPELMLDASTALYAKWRNRLGRFLDTGQVALLKGIYRRWRFERCADAELHLDELDRQALRGC